MTKAFDSAVRLLARREHGAAELCDKLQRKGFESSEVTEALAECQRLGLQSDSRFVEIYTHSRVRQGYGPLKISQELNSKGVSKELIQAVLQADQDYWLARASDVLQKKNKGQFDLSFGEWQKQQRFLLYRGFGMDIIAMLAKELKSTAIS